MEYDGDEVLEVFDGKYRVTWASTIVNEKISNDGYIIINHNGIDKKITGIIRDDHKFISDEYELDFDFEYCEFFRTYPVTGKWLGNDVQVDF